MKTFLIAIMALALGGCVTNPTTGKQELDPTVRNALLDTARSAVGALATGYQTTGKFNWADMAQGALSQVYSVDSRAAINTAIGRVITDPGYKAAVTTAVNTVVDSAQNKGLDERSAILTGATLIDQVLQASKAP